MSYHQCSNPIKQITIEMDDGRIFRLDSADVLSVSASGSYGGGPYVVTLELLADELGVYYGAPQPRELPGTFPLLAGDSE